MYEIIDAPKHRKKYEWHRLYSLPSGKALQLICGSRGEAEIARSGAISYAKYNGLKVITEVEVIKGGPNDGNYSLSVMRIE